MGFFTEIAALNLAGDLLIVIRQSEPNKLAVSTSVRNETVKAEGAKKLIPLNLVGTPEEMDEGFFTHLTKEVVPTAGLLVNLEEHRKAVEEARKTTVAKPTTSTNVVKPVEKTEAEKAKESFESAMKVIDELVKQKKYQEAIKKLPKVKDLPTYAWEIKQKQNEILNLYAGTSTMFDPPLEVPKLSSEEQDMVASAEKRNADVKAAPKEEPTSEPVPPVEETEQESEEQDQEQEEIDDSDDEQELDPDAKLLEEYAMEREDRDND